MQPVNEDELFGPRPVTAKSHAPSRAASSNHQADMPPRSAGATPSSVSCLLSLSELRLRRYLPRCLTCLAKTVSNMSFVCLLSLFLLVFVSCFTRRLPNAGVLDIHARQSSPKPNGKLLVVVAFLRRCLTFQVGSPKRPLTRLSLFLYYIERCGVQRCGVQPFGVRARAF